MQSDAHWIVSPALTNDVLAMTEKKSTTNGHEQVPLFREHSEKKREKSSKKRQKNENFS
jgi:hypothetical protein